MADAIVIEHDDKVYEIAVDDLAQFEVKDEAAKGELVAAAEQEPAEGDDEVAGFARLRSAGSARAWMIIRR